MIHPPVESQGPDERRRSMIQMGHTFATKAVIAGGRAALLVALVRAFSPADFGAYSLITTSLTFGLILLGLNANLFIYRAVPGAPREQGERVLVSVAAFELGTACMVVLVGLLSGLFDAGLAAFGVKAYRTAFALATAWVVVELLCQELLNYLYARQRIGQANVLDILKQVAWIPLPIGLWLLHGTLTVEDVIASVLIGACIAAVYGIALIRPHPRRPDRTTIGAALRIATPLIVPQLSFYALKLADRYILSATRGLDETGVYSLVASLANLLYSFSALVVASTLTPQVVRAHNEGRPADRDLMLWRLTKYSLVLFVAGALLTFAAVWLLLPFVRPEYGAALPLFPYVIAGYMMIILASAPQTWLWLANRVRTIVVIDAMSATAAVGLDLVLIPRVGAYGAAVGTLLGFGVGALAKQRASGLWRTFPWRDLAQLREERRAITTLARDIRQSRGRTGRRA